MTTHQCSLPYKDDEVVSKLNWCTRIKMISVDNPRRLNYFRSNISVNEEQKRHLKVNKLAIHPFSKFKAWYDVFLIYLYLSLVVTKPFDAGFLTRHFVNTTQPYKYYTIVTAILSVIDIFLNFFMGYELPNNSVIELRSSQMARQYLLGPYFIWDVVSIIPRATLLTIENNRVRRAVSGTVGLLGMFKIIRIISLMRCFRNSAEYFGIMTRSKVFLISTMCTFTLIAHWMTCMQFFVPRILKRSYQAEISDDSWFMYKNGSIYWSGISIQYMHSFFRSSSYILGVRLVIYRASTNDEFALAIITYFIGKIMIAFMWIILAVAILNSRLVTVKYEETMNQLEEYMHQKQLPPTLRSRILRYFQYKFCKKYFKEQLVHSLLSENLRNETTMHVCRTLIENVYLFSQLSPTELRTFVDSLIPEIFLPNDIIIHAGTIGDAMYFLNSGTVAVYTRSGKEVCHLQDGAYFGEVSLVLKGTLRMSTIIALETTQVYRLNKRDLEKKLLSNKTVRHKILNHAEKRFNETLRIEEEYKEMLLKQTFT